MNAPQRYDLRSTFLALDDSGGAVPLAVDEQFWSALMQGQVGPFPRMVSFSTIKDDWGAWERHPAGDEFVCLLHGNLTLHVETTDGQVDLSLFDPGQYALVPANAWHTVTVQEQADVLFITPGEGTQHRPR